MLIPEDLNGIALTVAKILYAYLFEVWVHHLAPNSNQESHTGSDNSMSRSFTSQTKIYWFVLIFVIIWYYFEEYTDILPVYTGRNCLYNGEGLINNRYGWY